MTRQQLRDQYTAQTGYSPFDGMTAYGLWLENQIIKMDAEIATNVSALAEEKHLRGAKHFNDYKAKEEI